MLPEATKRTLEKTPELFSLVNFIEATANQTNIEIETALKTQIPELETANDLLPLIALIHELRIILLNSLSERGESYIDRITGAQSNFLKAILLPNSPSQIWRRVRNKKKAILAKPANDSPDILAIGISSLIEPIKQAIRVIMPQVRFSLAVGRVKRTSLEGVLT